MSNFLITGLGRSGTGFLAKVLNRSKKFTVVQEFSNGEDDNIPGTASWVLPQVQKRFDSKDWYGEVNSRLRHVFLKLERIDYKGIIVRHPLNIIESGLRRQREFRGLDQPHYRKRIFGGFKYLDEAISTGIDWWYFEDMISDFSCIEKICKKIGITDVDLSDINLSSKVSPTKEKRIGIEGLKKEELNLVFNKTQWYIDKYYKGTKYGHVADKILLNINKK